MSSLNRNHLFKGPISKHSHIRARASPRELQEVTIQSITWGTSWLSVFCQPRVAAETLAPNVNFDLMVPPSFCRAARA